MSDAFEGAVSGAESGTTFVNPITAPIDPRFWEQQGDRILNPPDPSGMTGEQLAASVLPPHLEPFTAGDVAETTGDFAGGVAETTGGVLGGLFSDIGGGLLSGLLSTTGGKVIVAIAGLVLAAVLVDIEV